MNWLTPTGIPILYQEIRELTSNAPALSKQGPTVHSYVPVLGPGAETRSRRRKVLGLGREGIHFSRFVNHSDLHLDYFAVDNYLMGQ